MFPSMRTVTSEIWQTRDPYPWENKLFEKHRQNAFASISDLCEPLLSDDKKNELISKLPGGIFQILKEARKSKKMENGIEIAKLYYNLLCIKEIVPDYSVKAKTPGHNVLYLMPGKLIADLKFPYKEIGYEKLRLSTKGEAQWLEHYFGKPSADVNVYDYYYELIEPYENVLIKDREIQNRKMLCEFVKLYLEFIEENANQSVIEDALWSVTHPLGDPYSMEEKEIKRKEMLENIKLLSLKIGSRWNEFIKYGMDFEKNRSIEENDLPFLYEY